MPSEYILVTPGGSYAVGDRFDSTGYVSGINKLPGGYGIAQIFRDAPTVTDVFTVSIGGVDLPFTLATLQTFLDNAINLPGSAALALLDADGSVLLDADDTPLLDAA